MFLLSLVVAIIALVVAYKASKRADELRERLMALEARAAAAPLPPPIPAIAEAEHAPPLVGHSPAILERDSLRCEFLLHPPNANTHSQATSREPLD